MTFDIFVIFHDFQWSQIFSWLSLIVGTPYMYKTSLPEVPKRDNIRVSLEFSWITVQICWLTVQICPAKTAHAELGAKTFVVQIEDWKLTVATSGNPIACIQHHSYQWVYSMFNWQCGVPGFYENRLIWRGVLLNKI